MMERSVGGSSIDPRVLDKVVAEYEGKPGALLSVLEELQHRNERNYLPREALIAVADRLRLPLSQVFSVATFYAFFNLEPQGRHTVCVCRGTACHTRGSRTLLEHLETTLDLPKNPAKKQRNFVTTPDGKFTVRTVACFGQCALAPVVEVDRKILGNVSRQSLQAAVDGVGSEGGRK